MPNGKNKTVVYFIAKYDNQIPVHNDAFEKNEYMVNDQMSIFEQVDLFTGEPVKKNK